MQRVANIWSATVDICFLSGMGIHCLIVFTIFTERRHASDGIRRVSVCVFVCL